MSGASVFALPILPSASSTGSRRLLRPSAARSGPERPFVADLAERLGCSIVEPALVGALQAGEQRIHCPGVADLAEGLCGRHPDVLVPVLQALSIRPGTARRSRMSPRMSTMNFRTSGSVRPSTGSRASTAPAADLHQRFDGRVPRTGVIV